MTGAGIATVARQEFRLRIRAGRWKVLLGIWFLLLALFTGLLTAALGGLAGRKVLDEGVVLYGGLVLFVLGLALLVVPALAAQSVNGDRERGTLATLQVSRLTPGDIALGKFFAAWGTSLAFLALVLPSVVFASTRGGVSLGRVLATTGVLALLLGTVCAIALALSACLSRTTTSGVLAYLSVAGLTLGTLLAFLLVTATTTEHFSQAPTCPTPADLPAEMSPDQKSMTISECQRSGPYTSTRTRTDRTWWLLAANPFVVLADAAPQLPPLTPAERRDRQQLQDRGETVTDARDVDPLGAIGRSVRGLRRAPDPLARGAAVYTANRDPSTVEPRGRLVWPTGLAIDLALAAGSLVLTIRKLRTPSNRLARGQRIA